MPMSTRIASLASGSAVERLEPYGRPYTVKNGDGYDNFLGFLVELSHSSMSQVLECMRRQLLYFILYVHRFARMVISVHTKRTL